MDQMPHIIQQAISSLMTKIKIDPTFNTNFQKTRKVLLSREDLLTCTGGQKRDKIRTTKVLRV